jgi:glycine oxidase
MPANPGMDTSADVIVIGGGAQGMISARRLAEAGRKVVLVERDRIGHGTSRAGGGIMSPLKPWAAAGPVSRLAEISLPLLPDLAAALQRDTGINPEYRASGMIYLDCEELEAALAFATRHGMRAELLDEAALAAVAPAAARSAGPSLFLPELAQIRNPRLLDALAADLRRRGVAVLEQAGEVRLVRSGDGVAVEAGPHGRLQAAATVVAAGAWSSPLVSGLGVQLPVVPVRGQILWYMLPRPVLSHMLMRGDHYVIPRHEGVVLVGSTVEHAGFDMSTTPEAADALRAAAARMMPLLGGLAAQGQWAGLRPASPDGIPLIGPMPGIPGLWVNTGHFRNGVNLAPGSAELLAALLGGTPPPLDPAPYDPAARMAQSGPDAYNPTH